MSESRRKSLREARLSLWFLGSTLVGGAGGMITGEGDNPLRHILPNAVNYFQHSGNMLWSGFLGAGALILARNWEVGRGAALQSARRFAGTAALAGLVVGGAANATMETHIGYEAIGKHLGLVGGNTPDPWDLVWGTIYTSIVAAGMGGDLRRFDLNTIEGSGNTPDAPVPQQPTPSEIPGAAARRPDEQ